MARALRWYKISRFDVCFDTHERLTLYSKPRVIVATATQLSYLHTLFRPDFTRDSFSYIICTQVVQTLSIVTACVPYLQPFLESLNTGLLWTKDIQVQGHLSDGYGSHNPRNTRRKYTNIETQPGISGGNMELRTLRDQYETGVEEK